jgi:RNA polymerase sigma-70 factor (family 1)
MNYTDFYHANFDTLLLTASYYLSQEDAEDVVQDVLLMMYEKRDTFDFVHHLEAYASATVRNRCLDRVKHEAYRREYFRRTLMAMHHDLQMEMLSNHSSVSADVELREMQALVSHAVSRLPARCRTIFTMSRVGGLRYQEISEALGISVNTVECQMTIALKKLRGWLKAV